MTDLTRDNTVNQANMDRANIEDTVKIYAPVMTHEVDIPTTDKKEPMAIIPIPESQALMGVPIETLSKLLNSQISKTVRDEQHARDLLIWNDGIGTLDGCDLRFKINQLGCLELLDSDDEADNYSSTFRRRETLPNATATESSDMTGLNRKRAKNPVRQISPGSSLLRDGPNIRRQKPLSRAALMKKIENNQNSVLMEKLIPKQKLEELKTKVSDWSKDDVKEFVDSIPGCSGYGERFRAQEICGKSFLYLDQRDLLEVINVKLGPAVKIYHAISLLK